jgi:hypothetical protein
MARETIPICLHLSLEPALYQTWQRNVATMSCKFNSTNLINMPDNFRWICANVLMIVRGESGRSSTIKRNKRNRRRFAAAGFNVVHGPPSELTPKIATVNKATIPARPIGQLGKTPITNFSDSMSSTRSSHEEESKSGAESNSGLKKRKNVSKKNSNESQNEASQPLEPKPKPVIKVSAMPIVERPNNVPIAKKPEPVKLEEVKVEEPINQIEEEVKFEKPPIEETKTKLIKENSAESVEEYVQIEKPTIEVEKPNTKITVDNLPVFEAHLGLSDQASIELKFNDEEHSNTHEEDRADFSDASPVPEWVDASVAQGKSTGLFYGHSLF